MRNSSNSLLVSIIITTYNRWIYLKETLHSIQNQTYQNIEIILIDDGSHADIAKKNKEIATLFHKCQYYYKENTGQPDSRNYGFLKSRGDLIGFCDDDDSWSLNKLENQIQIFIENPDYSVVNSCIEYVNESGQRTGVVKCHNGFNHGYIFEQFLIKNRMSSITPLMKREVFNTVGLFNKNFTIAEDWEFWRRVSYYYKIYTIDEVLAFVRLHQKSMTNSKLGTAFEGYEIYRKLTKTLLNWGHDKFKPEEKQLIHNIEWLRYRKLMGNHYPGTIKKLCFFIKVLSGNLKDGIHLFILFLRFGIFKYR